MKSSWKIYQGKRIFFARYDKLTIEELRSEIGAAEKAILYQPSGSVLMLIDTTGTIITPEALNIFKNTALRTKQYMSKTAVLGVTGSRRVMLEMIVKFSGMKLVSFDTLQQAKDWLME